MNIVFIVPTGIGAEIGGHSGDAAPAAKLIASLCDKLIVHPNVVNASDINEMTENMLYVEGSILDRFLEGRIELKEVNINRILVVVNPPVENVTINAVQAARATIGADVEIMELEVPLKMIGRITSKGADGEVSGWEHLIWQAKKYDFDAFAIHSPIEVDEVIKLNYYQNGGINPWGFVEAKASKLIADRLDKPVAHAPLAPKEIYNEIVDPRQAAEMLSNSYLHCVLKGLYKAPRIGTGLSVKDIDFMVSPWGCIGRPHEACIQNNISVIMVKENQTILNDKIPDNFIRAENYLEAVGIIAAKKAGVTISSIKRPLERTKIIKKNNG